MHEISEWYKKNKNTIILFFIILAYILLTAAIIFTPYSSDDFVYMNQWQSDEPIRNLNDIIFYEKEQYFQWTGRIVSHSIVQILFLIGKPWSSFLISGVYFLLAYEISSLVSNHKNKKTYFLMALSLLWLLNPDFKETVLWYTGAANYLWTATIMFTAVRPAIKLLRGESIIPRDYLFLPLLFLAGGCNENMSTTMILMMIFEFFYLKKRDGKYNIWLLAGIIISSISCAMMILAPGNVVRSHGLPTGVLSVAYRGYGQISAWLNWLLPTWILYVFSRFLLSKYQLKESILGKSFIFWAVISILVMIASPTYPDRATFGTMVLIITAAMMNLYAVHSEYGKLYDKTGMVMTVGFCGTMLCTAVLAFVRSAGVVIPG